MPYFLGVFLCAFFHVSRFWYMKKSSKVVKVVKVVKVAQKNQPSTVVKG